MIVPYSILAEFLNLLANISEAQTFDQLGRGFVVRKMTHEDFVKFEGLKCKSQHAAARPRHYSLPVISSAQPVRQFSTVINQRTVTMKDANEAYNSTK